MKNSFLMAEDFRQETNNKITAIGLYAAQAVLLLPQPGEEALTADQRFALLPTALDRLAFAVTTTEITGEHVVYLQILTPSGKLLMETEKSTIQIAENLKDFGHSYVVRTNVFPIPEIGKYICRYWVDKKHEDFPILVYFQLQ